MFYLHRIDDNSEIRMREELTVGRSETDVKVSSDQSVSKQHCIFRMTGDSASVMDLGSATGTFLNGIALEASAPVFLSHNDVIKVGKAEFRFVDEKLEEVLRLPSISESFENIYVRGMVTSLSLVLILYFAIEKGLGFGLKHSSLAIIVFLISCWVLSAFIFAPVAALTISLVFTKRLKVIWSMMWAVTMFATFSFLAGIGQILVPSARQIAENRISYHCIKKPKPNLCARVVARCEGCIDFFDNREKIYVRNVLKKARVQGRSPAQKKGGGRR